MPNPAKPTALKLLEGNPGQRRLRPEPQPRRGIPPCPAWLDGEARREWRRITPELDRLGLITVVDRVALAAYCQSFARWYLAEKERTVGGDTHVTQTGYEAVRPCVTISQKERQLMRAFLSDFGLTPASRTRVAAAPAEARPEGIAALLD